MVMQVMIAKEGDVARKSKEPLLYKKALYKYVMREDTSGRREEARQRRREKCKRREERSGLGETVNMQKEITYRQLSIC